MFGNILPNCIPIVQKKSLKRSAIAFWSSNSFLSIKSLTAEDLTFALERPIV